MCFRKNEKKERSKTVILGSFSEIVKTKSRLQQEAA